MNPQESLKYTNKQDCRLLISVWIIPDKLKSFVIYWKNKTSIQTQSFDKMDNKLEIMTENVFKGMKVLEFMIFSWWSVTLKLIKSKQ